MRLERKKFTSLMAVACLAGVLGATVFAQEEAVEGTAAESGIAAESTMETAPMDSAAVDSAAVDSLANWGTGFDDLGVVEETETGFLDRMASSGAVEQFQKGGVFMWPLLILFVIGVAVILERFWTLGRARTNVRTLMNRVLSALKGEGGIEAAIEVCEKTRGPIPAILHAGLRRSTISIEATEKAIESAGVVELSFLERGLLVLATIANVAPLLGFLGTVSGMVSAFDAIAAADQVNAKLVASGISEALLTTMSGLIVAIPMSIGHNYFVSQIDRFVIEMQETSADLVDTLVDLGVKQAGVE
jgi:biopolymer transport protein ExbB